MLIKNDNDEAVYMKLGDTGEFKFISLEDEMTSVLFKFNDDAQIALLISQLQLLLESQ